MKLSELKPETILNFLETFGERKELDNGTPYLRYEVKVNKNQRSIIRKIIEGLNRECCCLIDAQYPDTCIICSGTDSFCRASAVLFSDKLALTWLLQS